MAPRIWILAAAAVAAVVWSMRLELAFYRLDLGRAPRAAIVDVIVFRAIAWPLATAYFLGFAIWPMVVAWRRG